MAKRKFIEIITNGDNTANKNFPPTICNTEYKVMDTVLPNVTVNIITEHEIVKPYFAKILNNIVDDEFLQKNMSGEVWERIEDIVNNLLSEDGEEE